MHRFADDVPLFIRMLADEMSLFIKIFAILFFFPASHAVLGVLLIIIAFSSQSVSSGNSSMEFSVDGVMKAAAAGDFRGLAAVGGILLIILTIIEVLFIYQ